MAMFSFGNRYNPRPSEPLDPFAPPQNKYDPFGGQRQSEIAPPPMDPRDVSMSAYDLGDQQMQAGSDMGASRLGKDDPSYWAERGEDAPADDPLSWGDAEAGLSMMGSAQPKHPAFAQVRRTTPYQRQPWSSKAYGQY